MIGYKNELERLQREKKDLTQSINDNKIKKENEIKEAQRLIEEKYDGLIQKDDRNLRETREAIDFLKKKIVECSHFRFATVSSLISVLIDIIKVSEGKEYIIQEVDYTDSSFDPDNEVKKAFIIINKDRKLNESIKIHQLSEINIRIKEGNVFVLNWDASLGLSYINFYDLKDNNIKHNVSFGKFNYIKKFIDYIISYRLENGIKELTPKDLEKLEIMFLRDNFYDIQEYHKYLIDNEKENAIENIERSASHREKILFRRIKKQSDGDN